MFEKGKSIDKVRLKIIFLSTNIYIYMDIYGHQHRLPCSRCACGVMNPLIMLSFSLVNEYKQFNPSGLVAGEVFPGLLYEIERKDSKICDKALQDWSVVTLFRGNFQGMVH